MTDNLSRIKRTSQAIDNFGFDEDYMKPTVEILTENEAGTELVTQKKIATEAKQDSIIANQNPLAGYVLQAPDDYTTTNVTYFSGMKPDGTWMIIKLDETGNYPVYTFANISNNATMTTYALAFASRTSLTYQALNLITL